MNGSSTKGRWSSPMRGRGDLYFGPTDLHFDEKTALRGSSLRPNGSSPRPVNELTSTSTNRPPIECFGFVCKWVGLGFMGAGGWNCDWFVAGLGLDWILFFICIWFVLLKLWLICSLVCGWKIGANNFFFFCGKQNEIYGDDRCHHSKLWYRVTTFFVTKLASVVTK